MITSYAGFSGESNLLEGIYKRGIQGQRIDDDLEIYADGDLFMFWSNTPRQPWLIGTEGEEYYESQRKILRPNQFQRLHRNEWVSSENSFIEPADYDSCVESMRQPDLSGSFFIGVDASVRNDSTACVAVKYDEHSDRLRLVLADYKIWATRVWTLLAIW